MNDSPVRPALSDFQLAEVGTEGPEVGMEAPLPRRRATTLRRLLHAPSGLIGLGLLLVVAIPVALAPLLARYPPNAINVDALNLLPSGSHLFGTDFLGRDLWSRTLYGGRISLEVGLGVVAMESIAGTILGLLAGYAGRAIDGVIMRTTEILLSIPGLMLALGVIAVLGTGTNSLIVALGIGGIPLYTRLARGMVLRIRELEYVQAARAAGCGRFRLVRRHILPGVLDPLIVLATANFGGAILAASALSYLGVGSQPPNADWGTLLQTGYEYMFQTWNGIVLPGIAVSITVLGSTLLGDGLADARNPRL